MAYTSMPAVGSALMKDSMPVTLAADGPVVTTMGTTVDPPATDFIGSTSIVSLFKTLVQKVSLILDKLSVAIDSNSTYELSNSTNSTTKLVLNSINVSIYSTAIIQVIMTGLTSANYVIEGSNDDVSWNTFSIVDLVSSAANNKTSSLSGSSLFLVPCLTKFIRIRATQITGTGTLTAKVICKK